MVTTGVITPPMGIGSGEPRNLREFLAATVRKHGRLPALRARVGSAYKSLTYDELGQAAESFGAGLIGLGLRPGDRVALVAANSIEWVVGWLGVALAGGVNVPIYGELSAHEINNIARQSDSRYAIVGAEYVSKVDSRPLERVIVAGRADRNGETVATIASRLGSKGVTFAEVAAAATHEDRRQFAAVDLRPGDLASIIYTSGTTGDPKGVMLSHRNLTSNAIATPRVVSVTSADRLLLVLPLHHSFPFTAGLLAPLHVGIEIVFETDLRRIRERMAEIRPTIFFGVPALYGTMHRSILAKLESEGKLEVFRKGERISAEIKRRTGVNVGKLIFRELHEKLGGRINFFAVGGAAMPPDLIRKFALLGIPVLQGWGLSEASPVVAGQSLSRRRFLFTNFYERMAGSVGRPLPGVELALIDVPDKHIYVQIHGEGEFLLRGPNVMHGYYKNEASTREAMLDDWLRTGDVGRIDRNGYIYLTGRAKSVIVLDSGEKVYPDELEERFEESALARDICIIGRRSGRLLGERKVQVCAVVHPDPIALRERARDSGERLTADLVRRWVQQEVERIQANVAPYKRVAEVILTDTALPRTDLRKVRRGSIKEHYSFDLDKLLSADEDALDVHG